MIMRFGKWMSKLPFLIVMLRKIFSWSNLKVLNPRKAEKCAIDLSMVKSKLRGVGTIILLRLSVLIVSLKMRTSHMFTRRLMGAN